MAKKSKTKKRAKVAYPGMMGDGTEEQNLGQRGNPEGAYQEERKSRLPSANAARKNSSRGRDIRHGSAKA